MSKCENLYFKKMPPNNPSDLIHLWPGDFTVCWTQAAITNIISQKELSEKVCSLMHILWIFVWRNLLIFCTVCYGSFTIYTW